MENIYSFPHGRTFQTQSQLSPNVHGGRDVNQIKNGKPVIASNINVFRFIVTNEMVSIRVLHCTKVYRMLKRKKKQNPTESFTFCLYTCCLDSTSVHITHSQLTNENTEGQFSWGGSSQRRTNKNASIYIHCMYQILART